MALLRILSINLLVDRADPDDVRRMILDADPDVVCAQELGPRTASVMADLLAHGHLDPRPDLFGLGIATRFPTTIDKLDLEERSGWIARLEPDRWPGLKEPLDIFNVHLVNPIDRPWGVSRQVRRRQVDEITAEVNAHDVAAVVIGDMNATPLWREYKRLAEIGTDAARASGSARKTWSPFVFGPRLLRIDHAFVKGVRPTATSVIRVRGTDHRALVVDIEL
ncbi:MAG: hypothetical protein E2O95_03705 [Acidobacteria bacterium]|nr:MAG: hypothetical protein E2O95_03705 [Acidobacteriota bacterium]